MDDQVPQSSRHVGQPTPAASPLAKPARREYRRKLPHMQPPDTTIAVTFNTKGRWLLPESVRTIVLECCSFHHHTKIQLHAAVVMPDHVHLLLTPLRDLRGSHFGLAEVIGSIKSVSARRVNIALGRRGHVWQDESFDHVLRLDEGLRAQAEYICDNPVRAGIARSQDEYPWLWREWIEGSN
jgi:REP element-mobilizing transposase RayT